MLLNGYSLKDSEQAVHHVIQLLVETTRLEAVPCEQITFDFPGYVYTLNLCWSNNHVQWCAVEVPRCHRWLTFAFGYWENLFFRVSVKPRPNDRNMPMQHIATLLGATCRMHLVTVLWCVVTCWVLLAQVWKWSNLSQQQPPMSQHVTTGWSNAHNMLHPMVLQYVVLSCVDRLARA